VSPESSPAAEPVAEPADYARIVRRARSYGRPRGQSRGEESLGSRVRGESLEQRSRVWDVQRYFFERSCDARESLGELRAADGARRAEVPEQLRDSSRTSRIHPRLLDGHRQRAFHEFVVVKRHVQLRQSTGGFPRVAAAHVLAQEMVHLATRGGGSGALGSAPRALRAVFASGREDGSPGAQRDASRGVVETRGVDALVEEVSGDDVVDDGAREEMRELVGGSRDVDGEGLEFLEEEVETSLALGAGEDVAGAEVGEELGGHLAFARAAVEGGDDRALRHRRAEGGDAQGSRGALETGERRSREGGGQTRAEGLRVDPSGTTEKLLQTVLDVGEGPVGEVLSHQALALALEVRLGAHRRNVSRGEISADQAGRTGSSSRESRGAAGRREARATLSARVDRDGDHATRLGRGAASCAPGGTLSSGSGSQVADDLMMPSHHRKSVTDDWSRRGFFCPRR